MQTQKQPPIAVVLSESTRPRETVFHAFAWLSCVTAAWIVFGCSKARGQEMVRGQEYETVVPGYDGSPHGVLEWSEPMVNGYTSAGYLVEGAINSSTPHRVLQPPVANPLRMPPSQYTQVPYSQVPYSQSPYGPSTGNSTRPGHVASTAKEVFDETLHTDGPLLRRLHEHKQPSQAKIPQAAVEPQWKAPYAYGYFGASGTKHWIKSSGYRDTYKRWTKQ